MEGRPLHLHRDWYWRSGIVVVAPEDIDILFPERCMHVGIKTRQNKCSLQPSLASPFCFLVQGYVISFYDLRLKLKCEHRSPEGWERGWLEPRAGILKRGNLWETQTSDWIDHSRPRLSIPRLFHTRALYLCSNPALVISEASSSGITLPREIIQSGNQPSDFDLHICLKDNNSSTLSGCPFIPLILPFSPYSWSTSCLHFLPLHDRLHDPSFNQYPKHFSVHLRSMISTWQNSNSLPLPDLPSRKQLSPVG